jgi:endonuclease YncB( thermonuclease family)
MKSNFAHETQRLSKSLICIVGVFAALNLHAEVLLGRVVHVADGDTITLLDSKKIQHKIRLSGIDAPEKYQPFADESKKSLSDLVADQNVTVYWDKQDKFSRKLGKVMLNNLDCNLEQISRGMAWHYKKYQNEQSLVDRQTYASAEEEARLNKSGLWIDSEPTSPWEFRTAPRMAN